MRWGLFITWGGFPLAHDGARLKRLSMGQLHFAWLWRPRKGTQ